MCQSNSVQGSGRNSGNETILEGKEVDCMGKEKRSRVMTEEICVEHLGIRNNNKLWVCN